MVHIVLADITGSTEKDAKIRIAAIAFESGQSMMVTDPNGIILRVNQAFIESTGYTAEEAVNQTPSLLKSGHHPGDFYRVMWETIRRTGGWQGEVWDRRKNGEIYSKWLTISAVKGNDGVVTHYLGTHHRIAERKIEDQRIKDLAFIDPLTKLPNRTLLLDRLKQAMTQNTARRTFGSVLFIDIDHFKMLNDTLGHDKGDLLLLQVTLSVFD